MINSSLGFSWLNNAGEVLEVYSLSPEVERCNLEGTGNHDTGETWFDMVHDSGEGSWTVPGRKPKGKGKGK